MKVTANSIMNTQGILRNIEYLGTQKLPYRMKFQETYAYEGRYIKSIYLSLFTIVKYYRLIVIG